MSTSIESAIVDDTPYGDQIDSDVHEAEDVDNLDGFEQPLGYFYETATDEVPNQDSRTDIAGLEVSRAIAGELVRPVSRLSESTAAGSTFAHRGSVCSSTGLPPSSLALQDEDDLQDEVVISDDESFDAEYTRQAWSRDLSDQDLNFQSLPYHAPRLSHGIQSVDKGGFSTPVTKSHRSRIEDKENKSRKHKIPSEGGFRSAAEVLRDMQGHDSVEQ